MSLGQTPQTHSSCHSSNAEVPGNPHSPFISLTAVNEGGGFGHFHFVDGLSANHLSDLLKTSEACLERGINFYSHFMER